MELKEKRNKKKKDKFNKLHPSVRNIVVMASAGNSGEACPKSNCETTDPANQELNFMFTSMHLTQVGFVHGVVQHLHT
eukprot:43027-Ditylum_brightwellii.AAC.1